MLEQRNYVSMGYWLSEDDFLASSETGGYLLKFRGLAPHFLVSQIEYYEGLHRRSAPIPNFPRQEIDSKKFIFQI